jgi:hypothetical protein
MEEKQSYPTLWTGVIGVLELVTKSEVGMQYACAD